MMRFDPCASADTKMRMDAEGDATDDDERQALPIDARLTECLQEWPRTVVPVWRRPWIGGLLRRARGWPVEYRAIVHNGRASGRSRRTTPSGPCAATTPRSRRSRPWRER